VVRAHTYFPGFGFSYSIKKVGPALAPHVTYDDLEHVADGSAASSVFVRLAARALSTEENLEELRSALLKYCERDTLAMVEVHRALKNI
jgi:hypothetical protein